jgi:nucleotide-binding universal stress UspA family protein
MARNIVIAVDTKERTLDALALGRVLTEATRAPAVLVTVFPYIPLDDPLLPELTAVRDEARATLLELGASEGVEMAEAHVIAGNFAARELQHMTEAPDTGLIVVGSTTRGPIGRLLVGGVGERLLAGAACPVAVAPRGYADDRPSRLECIGVGVDASDEARRGLDAAVALARASGARLRVITAFQPLVFGGVTTTALPSASLNEVMRTDLRASHEAAIGEARRSVETAGRFLDGSAEEVLEAESEDVDLLVTGSRGYGPLGAVLLGSVTSALFRNARCPVLVTPRETRFDLLGAV